MLSSIERVSVDQYHTTVSWAQMSTHHGCVFSKLSADKLLVFNWSQAQFKVNFFPMVTNLLFEVIYFTGVFPLAKSVFLMIVPLTAIDRPLPYFVMGIMASIFSVAQIYLVLTLTAYVP